MTQNFVISSSNLLSISTSVFPLMISAELSICKLWLAESFLKRFHYVDYLQPDMRYGIS